MGNFCSGASSIQADSIAFQLRNSYFQSKADTQTSKVILSRIAPGYESPQYQKLSEYIANLDNLQFVDPNFKQMQTKIEYANQPQVRSLKKLFYFEKLRLQRVYKDSNSDLDNLHQKQVQLCYVSSVFYLIGRAEDLKQQIFVTSLINPHSAYIIRLFCNGEPCSAIVDENIPTYRKNIKYLSINQPSQIWPILLEKAWCKQIGGYDKARGLSPQDCFEQITGIPAFTIWFENLYNIDKPLHQIINDSLSRRYWVVLTAKFLTKGIKQRQVFYVQKLNPSTQKYKLKTPYLDYEAPDASDPNNKKKGQLHCDLSEIKKYFEFITIGLYEPNYVNQSLRVESKTNEEVVYELSVSKPGKVNLRVMQFYQEYLSVQEKQMYSYSPVIMELYDEKFNIIDTCQGVLENLEGVRSSKLSKSEFVELRPGTYYLRLQIDWKDHSHINIANIVTYSQKNMLKIKKSSLDPLELSFKLLGYTLQQSKMQPIINEKQLVRIRHFEKIHGYIIGIENVSDQNSDLKVMFQGSENIRINHHSLVNNQLMVKLNGREERVFEVLPKDPRKKYRLHSFDIVKI